MARTVTSADRLAGWIEVTTLGEQVDRAAHLHPSADAVVFPTGRVTYRDLAGRVDQLSRGLIRLGVGPGDGVGVLMPQDVDNLATIIAAARIGAVAVPVNSRFRERELTHLVTHSGMRVLVTHESRASTHGFTALLEQSLPTLAACAGAATLELAEAPELEAVVVLGDAPPPWAVDEPALLAGARHVDDDEVWHRRQAVRVRDTAVIMYTSGTTAAPKGALLSHEALVRMGVVVARSRLFLTERDRVWSALPLFHIGGVAFAYACFAVGAAYVHAGQFDPAVAVRQLAEERCTVALPAFETIWLAVIDHADFTMAACPDLRLVFNVGIPERLRQMQARVEPAVQVSGLGGTEASSFLSIGVPDDSPEDRVTTCGHPLAGLEVVIVDLETDQVAAPGTLGEIRYRGWSRFDGYHRDAELTAASIDAEGWFHSGDLGTMDADGRLNFVTRLKDMLKVGGENVAAAEIEGLLLEHPAVLMAQVVGAPDARYVEVPAAFVQLRQGATADEQELVDHCLGTIATFKVPRYVRFVDEWPMSGTKVRKHVLRDRIAAELAASGTDQAPRLVASDRHAGG